ncbi:unnamed protein product [marine sediment metagenome]|uniref:Periplasmic copper-binding protein NosD beta helix domain-containing protein n=1 Tax=marine sediment metagenome TaxID=412755 RepID=X1BW18_9ZZZZ
MVDSDDNIIENNLIHDNVEDGIYLNHGNDYNNISGNIISNNWYALRLWGSSNNIVTENVFNDTQYWAVSLSQSSDNNQLYHNSFLDNTNNGWDESINTWDNGYPSGGNYWDDYTGIDNYHGVNQDIPGSDGMGDTPYPISGGNNQDNYPLMETFTGFYYDDFEDGTLDKWNIILGDWEVLTEPSGNHIAHLNIASEEGRRMVSKETIDDNVIITAEIKDF